MLEAYHLPALQQLPTTTWSYGSGPAAIQIRIPQLTPALLRRQLQALRGAWHRHLAERPIHEIVDVIDAAAARLADPRDPLRHAAESALPVISGYSTAMVRRILDGMIVDWRADRLWSLLRSEFSDPLVLDSFRPHGEGANLTRAFGPQLATHVFSGNVPGVAVTSLIRSLLVKSASLGKTAAGEPLLPALFAQAVAQTDPGLGACLAVTYWPGGAEALEGAAVTAADTVIVYGGTEAVASLRSRTPTGTRFLGYGHKLSFGVVARETLDARGTADTASEAALDVATFDQQGCVSPHLFYVEEGGSTTPREWARMLAIAMEQLERELPRGTLAPGEASAIRQLRGEAEFAQIAGSGTEIHSSPEGTAWTVIYEPDTEFVASCLNRVVRVKPIADLGEIAPLVTRVGPMLQTVGVAASAERMGGIASVLGRLGVSRVAPLGQMAWPPSQWHHDGRPPLRDLVRWCDLEQHRER
jgi:hypothetical protein